MPQHRYRPYAITNRYHIKEAFLSNGSLDWSELALLYYLDQYKQQVPWSSKAEASLHDPVSSTYRDHLAASKTGGGVWWWDTSLPIGLAGINDCNLLYHHGLASHSLYQNSLLNCMEDHHSSRSTMADQITMLLNLLCNSFLEVSDATCCH